VPYQCAPVTACTCTSSSIGPTGIVTRPRDLTNSKDVIRCYSIVLCSHACTTLRHVSSENKFWAIEISMRRQSPWFDYVIKLSLDLHTINVAIQFIIMAANGQRTWTCTVFVTPCIFFPRLWNERGMESENVWHPKIYRTICLRLISYACFLCKVCQDSNVFISLIFYILFLRSHRVLADLWSARVSPCSSLSAACASSLRIDLLFKFTFCFFIICGSCHWSAVWLPHRLRDVEL